jgi:hypothetical protein
MQTVLKVTGVFPKNSKECLELHSLIKDKAIRKMDIINPRILISIDSGIAYIVEMAKPSLMGPSVA